MSDLADKLTDQLVRDEGAVVRSGKHVVYQDHLGYWTLGYGRLVDRVRGGGISEEEASYLLNNDIQSRIKALSARLPFFSDLDEARQGVLVNMSFQLGVAGLLQFRRTLGRVAAGEYATAASQMMKSKWARQTPNRARRLSEQMRTGQWV